MTCCRGWRLGRLRAGRAAERGRAARRPRRGRARLRAVRGRALARGHARRSRARVLARVGDRPRGPLAAARAHHRRLLGAQRLRVLAGAPADYDEWGHGWSHAAIEPYLRRAERQMRVRRLAARGVVAVACGVRRGGRRRRDPASGQRGRHRALERRVRLPRSGARARQPDDPRRHARRSRAARRRPRGRRGDDGGRAAGRTVVLAAGAYGSPGILLRSGIGRSASCPSARA